MLAYNLGMFQIEGCLLLCGQLWQSPGLDGLGYEGDCSLSPSSVQFS